MSNNGEARFPDSAASSAAFVRWMVAGVALINLFVFGMVTFSLYRSFGEYEERAEVTARNLSQMLAQDIGREFEKIDITLSSAADEIERQLAHGGIDRTALNAFLERLQRRVPEVISMRTIDASGIVRYGRGVDLDTQLNNSDREYFTRQRDNPDAGPVVSRPVFARIDKQWVVPVSRAFHLADGSFGGVVYVNVALEHLARVFSSIDVGQRGSVSLRDAELRIFARRPVPRDVDRVIGEKLVVPELQELVESGRETGTYVSRQTVDGVERKFAVHKITNYPLYAVVGRATEEYMARWWDQAIKTAVLATLFLLTTLISSWLISRSWKRQVAAAADLAREEEKFHTVADYTHDWEYWEGPGRELLYISPSCERVTGYSPVQFQADPDLLYRIVHPDDAHRLAAHWHDVGHQDASAVDFRILRADGAMRWIAHACQPVFGRDGKYMGRRASNRDITERQEAEAAVYRLNTELEQRVVQRTDQLAAANHDLEEFSYSISHDLRTPLRAISGFAQILAEERAAGLDDEGRRLLEVIRANTIRMGRLIDELLEFLRLGRYPMELGPVDMVQLVQAVFAELQASMPDRHLHLELANLPPAWADRTMIRQVLRNLLGNAIAFTQSRPHAIIEVGGSSSADGEERYYVKDNGIGFDMKYIDKLFKVFEHLQRAGQFEGIGTGLAMVKRIIARHGGRTWAEGKVDAGATFYFSLPDERTGYRHEIK